MKGRMRKGAIKALNVVLLITLTFVIVVDLDGIDTVNAATKKMNVRKKVIYTENKFALYVKGETKKPTWRSSDKTVAKVSRKGVVTAKTPGEAIITAQVGKKKYSCKITVKQLLDIKTKVIDKGKTYRIKAKKKVKWKSSNKSVAIVSSNGKVTAKRNGTATITATTRKGQKGKARIKVNELVTVFVGASGVRRLRDNNNSFGQYKTFNNTLKFITKNGSDINWQATTTGLGLGGQRLLRFMKSSKAEKKYVRFHIILFPPGNCASVYSNEQDLQKAGQEDADKYNYIYDLFKSSGYNFNLYTKSLNPLEPEKPYSNYMVVPNDHVDYLSPGYRSPYKYELWNLAFSTQIENEYSSKIKYINVYDEFGLWATDYRTTDGYHTDPQTSVDLFEYIMINLVK